MPSTLDQPTLYQIRVQGRLDASWSPWFDDVTVQAATTLDGTAVTTLAGLEIDLPDLVPPGRVEVAEPRS